MEAEGTPRLLAVTGTRLVRDLEGYARHGATAAGGVDRPIFSPADGQARRQLVDDCRRLGLAVHVDAAANVVAVRAGSQPHLPPIMMGSHLDTVPNGGRYDGALGVLCALEVLRTLIEQQITTRHPVGLISLTGEEATAYGTSTFGSRALTGRLPDLGCVTLPDGRTVREALADAGGDWDGIRGAATSAGPLACFLEVHMEQGSRLEEAGRPLAAVSGVSGIYRQRLVFRGEAGHAGTTAMHRRHDALQGAARFLLAVQDLPAGVKDGDATATVGFLQVSPNSPNVIPGEVIAVTDLRSRDPHVLRDLAARASEAARRAAAEAGLQVEVEVMLDQAPVEFDPAIRGVMAAVLDGLGGQGEELTSLAGHDAVHLGARAPAGMLFVRCAGGVSHRPDEHVDPADAALGAEALLRTVLMLDTRLEMA